ncbi:pyrroline-5-carboxylate reductase [Natronobacillus azotifigens]|uniref:Pyrroline-5-carboxylate reductase n=1 Tax=Natronobacillus azotifigens TaxID=472978 RepID=A0A9J6R9B1_9BACI|nr:pyrroline-5-carboxylate reductase [Natronobacillus azotifigens]MCZ0702197.1 pyrroline-5-carboxylate reductase [Natronobacillus azotifigens]
MLNKIAFLGAGAMAEAIIAGVVQQGFIEPDKVMVTNKNDPEQLAQIKEKYQVEVNSEVKATIDQADVILLAMKPNDASSALAELKSFITKDVLILSVMAGVSTDYIAEQLAAPVAVVRVMPNTSAMIGQSATGLTKGVHATDEHMEIAKSLFETIGLVREVTEDEIHVITGLAGGGPAYFYYVIEALEDVSVELGLEKSLASDFIKQTILGAAQMLQVSSDDPATLRKKITSPAGTTEQGLLALDDYQVKLAFKQAIKQATNRSIELGKLLSE